MNRFGMLCAAFALCACGDPRDPFLGMYEGNATWVANWNDGTTTTDRYTDQVHVAPSRDGQRLFLSQLCGLPATVKRPDELEIGPTSCIGSTPGCTHTWTVTGGSATVEGARFTLQYEAELLSSCPPESFSASTTTTMDATRK
jgi:hypothetical protein